MSFIKNNQQKEPNKLTKINHERKDDIPKTDIVYLDMKPRTKIKPQINRTISQFLKKLNKLTMQIAAQAPQVKTIEPPGYILDSSGLAKYNVNKRFMLV